MHSDVHNVCYRSIGRTLLVTAIMRGLFCYFFSSVDCCAFLRPLSREFVHDESIYGFEESLVYRWFFSLFLFLPSRLYSRGFTRWHDATRLASFVSPSCSNFEFLGEIFDEFQWICVNLVPNFRESVFSPPFFQFLPNGCTRFRRMDGSQAGSSSRKRESVLSCV